MTNDSAPLTLNSPATVASLNQMMSWYKKDGVMPTEPSEALIASMFNEGKAAMVINGPWFVGDIDKKINVGFAVLPTVDRAKKPMRPWMTIEGAYVAASSANKEVAYELAKYLTTEEAGLILAVEGRQLHTNKAIYANPKVAADPVLIDGEFVDSKTTEWRDVVDPVAQLIHGDQQRARDEGPAARPLVQEADHAHHQHEQRERGEGDEGQQQFPHVVSLRLSRGRRCPRPWSRARRSGRSPTAPWRRRWKWQ